MFKNLFKPKKSDYEKHGRYWLVDERIRDKVKEKVELIELVLEKERKELEEKLVIDVDYNVKQFLNPEIWQMWLRIEKAKNDIYKVEQPPKQSVKGRPDSQ